MSLEITFLNNLDTLLEINNAAVPDVGQLSISKARWLISRLLMPGLAVLDGKEAGIIVVLSDRCEYDSDYYRWFTERYQDFLYVDRIVVASWARGRGVAQALYQKADELSQELNVAIAADVYVEPPNTPSLNFHQKMGFVEVGRQHFPAINKTAAKLMKYEELAKRLDQAE